MCESEYSNSLNCSRLEYSLGGRMGGGEEDESWKLEAGSVEMGFVWAGIVRYCAVLYCIVVWIDCNVQCLTSALRCPKGSRP